MLDVTVRRGKFFEETTQMGDLQKIHSLAGTRQGCRSAAVSPKAVFELDKGRVSEMRLAISNATSSTTFGKNRGA